jgi:hypothetical protein
VSWEKQVLAYNINIRLGVNLSPGPYFSVCTYGPPLLITVWCTNIKTRISIQACFQNTASIDAWPTLTVFDRLCCVSSFNIIPSTRGLGGSWLAPPKASLWKEGLILSEVKILAWKLILFVAFLWSFTHNSPFNKMMSSTLCHISEHITLVFVMNTYPMPSFG